ncbi:MAG: A/G-specific adenine glycosylase [Parasphingorhabdus sp.]|uniref:A/G-specific adenine glycosylase n=1 Tax=Parasphingorhabdus sp. TaxID=2709688 RepID=UPI0030027C65
MGVDRITGETQKITAKISAHYVDNARNLPWRIPLALSAAGSLPDPYHIWLSEVMLQQTTVAAVIAYFIKFTQRWPTVGDLAAADEADVLAAWAGLGYYARARNLHKCARYVTENLNGIFPEEEAELLKLPGIGGYTAAAIAAIAFGRRAVVVDANIERLAARLFAIDTPLPKGKADIRIAMDVLTPETGAGDFAQACMDIGASICTAKSPKCEICPVQVHCLAFAAGDQERYPVKPPKKAKPTRKGRFFWVEQDNKLLLVTRPSKGMLGSMRALPDDNWAAGIDGHGEPPFAGKWRLHENVIQHSFTHFSLEVDLAVYQSDKISINNDDNKKTDIETAIWWPMHGIEDAGLPTLFAKAVRWNMKQKSKGSE